MPDLAVKIVVQVACRPGADRSVVRTRWQRCHRWPTRPARRSRIEGRRFFEAADPDGRSNRFAVRCELQQIVGVIPALRRRRRLQRTETEVVGGTPDVGVSTAVVDHAHEIDRIVMRLTAGKGRFVLMTMPIASKRTPRTSYRCRLQTPRAPCVPAVSAPVIVTAFGATMTGVVSSIPSRQRRRTDSHACVGVARPRHDIDAAGPRDRDVLDRLFRGDCDLRCAGHVRNVSVRVDDRRRETALSCPRDERMGTVAGDGRLIHRARCTGPRLGHESFRRHSRRRVKTESDRETARRRRHGVGRATVASVSSQAV